MYSTGPTLNNPTRCPNFSLVQISLLTCNSTQLIKHFCVQKVFSSHKYSYRFIASLFPTYPAKWFHIHVRWALVPPSTCEGERWHFHPFRCINIIISVWGTWHLQTYFILCLFLKNVSIRAKTVYTFLSGITGTPTGCAGWRPHWWWTWGDWDLWWSLSRSSC